MTYDRSLFRISFSRNRVCPHIVQILTGIWIVACFVASSVSSVFACQFGKRSQVWWMVRTKMKVTQTWKISACRHSDECSELTQNKTVEQMEASLAADQFWKKH